MNFNNFGSNQPLSVDAGEGNYPIIRQPSIYSLTFDELQSTMGGIGKDFGSMNMDELLKNLWSVEETQTMASSSVGAEANGGLQKQGSLTLPRTLSQKNVDEVWKDISKEFSTGKDEKIGSGVNDNMPQRQQTLGDITLEEFLVRAGVVREDNTQLSGVEIEFQRGARGPNLMGNWLSNGAQATNSLPQQHGLEYGIQGGGIGLVGLGGAVDVSTGSPANQLSSDGIRKCSGDTSSVSPLPYVFNGTPRARKSTTVEKAAERRQGRMIKNRESAARSRALKQAYTTALEAEIAKLKEENQELEKKQAQMMKLQKNQDMEMMSMQQGAKKRCLIRTQTGTW
ncbi:ABSCISIC ACID-INSENSITIVE 5-like protein 7 [Hibiscus syriacus]|uniref:ABSCISIC ACID-INSENSITIVE 5-like protein 7 n=1 Tax=Hibiscus syriacus TaxID=106335 RepID=A0A6A3B3K0_HIBSY|nr:ABSCISIC ACID-INSENSITIVE 5-like protein 7 [Hibiscus syriacus]